MPTISTEGNSVDKMSAGSADSMSNESEMKVTSTDTLVESQPASHPDTTPSMGDTSHGATDLANGMASSMTAPATDLIVGNDVDQAAVGFTLPSARGAEFSLDSFSGDKNVVVVFYRAFW